MSEALDLAVKILDEARTQIQANMALHYRTKKGERWVNARGKSAEAFQVVKDETHAKLIYQGDDIAPLETIQGGYKGDVSVDVIEQWRLDKIASGAQGIPPAEYIVQTIKEFGTERYIKNEDWIINTAVDLATSDIMEKIGAEYIKDLKTFLV